MKRTLSILTLSLALILGSIATPKPSASAIEYLSPGDKVIDAAGIIELIPEAKAGYDEECPNIPDAACTQKFYEKLRMSSGLGAAIYKFLSARLIITSVNPAKQTIKVVYNNTDVYGWREISDEEDVITELRIGWTEVGNNITSSVPADPADAPEYFHYVYNEKGSGWLEPYVETELTWSDKTTFGSSSAEPLQVTTITADSDTFDYVYLSSCLNSPYYEPGMECRIAFKENSPVSERTYLPFKEDGTPAYPYSDYHQETTEEPTEEPAEELTEEPTVTEPTEEPENPEDSPNDDSVDDPQDDEPIITNPAEDENTTLVPDDNDDTITPDDNENAVASPDDTLPDSVDDSAASEDTAVENPPVVNPGTTTIVVEPSVSSSLLASTTPSPTIPVASTSSATVATAETSTSTDAIETDTNADSESIIALNDTKETASIPFGGEVEEASSSSNFNFPWWAVTTILIGGVACAWFFWPKVRKN